MCRRFEGIATTFAAIAYLACGEGQRAATSEPEETVSDTVNMSVEPLDFASASERPVPAPVSPPPAAVGSDQKPPSKQPPCNAPVSSCPEGTVQETRSAYGRQEQYCTTPNGERHGPYESRAESRAERTLHGSYDRGKPAGIWITCERGQRVAQGSYTEDFHVMDSRVSSGEWTFWEPDGSKRIEHYDIDLRNGLSTTTFPAGQKKSEGYYLGNRKNGLWKTWDEAGALVKEELYLAGKLMDEVANPTPETSLENRLQPYAVILPDPPPTRFYPSYADGHFVIDMECRQHGRTTKQPGRHPGKQPLGSPVGIVEPGGTALGRANLGRIECGTGAACGKDYYEGRLDEMSLATSSLWFPVGGKEAEYQGYSALTLFSMERVRKNQPHVGSEPVFGYSTDGKIIRVVWSGGWGIGEHATRVVEITEDGVVEELFRYSAGSQPCD
jgi:hypothetical protein